MDLSHGVSGMNVGSMRSSILREQRAIQKMPRGSTTRRALCDGFLVKRTPVPGAQREHIRIEIMADPKSATVRALIFDLDGTLIDSKLDLIHSVNAMLCEMKRPQISADTISRYHGNREPPLVGPAIGCTADE